MSAQSSRATMRDVAALAGVSLKTVSRVVNDEAGVSQDVRERVAAAVRRLDYRPNLAASNLRRTGARTGLVGALVQDLSNSFSASLLRALEDSARLRGTAVLAASLDEESDREEELVHDLVTRRVDGLVLMPASERQDYLVAELRTGTPAVFVDREPRGVDADSVVVDNRAGAALATEHLLAHGHRRIAALVDMESIRTASLRHAGFTDAYAARGLRPDPRLVVTSCPVDGRGDHGDALTARARRPTDSRVLRPEHPLGGGGPCPVRTGSPAPSCPRRASTTSRWPTSSTRR